LFDRLKFNHGSFNTVSGEEPYFYATIATQFRTEIGPLLVRARIGAVTVNTVSRVDVGNLGLYVTMPEITCSAEYDVAPNFTALVPLGAVRMEAETEVYITLGAKMPLGRTAIASVFTLDSFFGIMVPLSATIQSSDFQVLPKLGILVPLSPVQADAAFQLLGRLCVMQLIHPTVISAEFNLSAMSVRTDENEEMVLEGLNLRPGQSLVIDTDTLEILVDDQVRVDCWVTGGSFFQFYNGDNILSFSDNAARRNLRVTVIWADRYL